MKKIKLHGKSFKVFFKKYIDKGALKLTSFGFF